MQSKAWIAILTAVGVMGAGHSYAASYYYDETAVDNQSVNAPYRFDYVVRGPSSARPTQVFSDGYETLLEFPSEVKPTYAIVEGDKLRLAYSKPYYVLKGEFASFKVRTTRGEIEVERRDNSQIASTISSRKAAPEPKKSITEADLKSRLGSQRTMADFEPGLGSQRTMADLEPGLGAQRTIMTLPAGTKLSAALADYVKAHDWDLKWRIDHDYYIEVPIPMSEDFFTAIYDLVKTYQAQGGMQGVIPRFAASNRVVSIEYLDNTNR
jgi:hypothetical protein